MSRDIDPEERSRFLSESDCHDMIQRLARFATGGGYTSVRITSVWTGNLRWARNQISTSGETLNNAIVVERNIRGASYMEWLNDTTDAALVAAVRRAERLLTSIEERPNSDLINRLPLEPSRSSPTLFSETTYQLDAEQRTAAAFALMKQAQDAGMLSAGYIEVAAVGMGILDSLGRVRYYPYTQARYSVTVRDPQGTGSGWAGVDWYDWHKIDASALTARAIDTCIKSRNPLAIEPGRYTAILEPQAVSDFVGPLFSAANRRVEGMNSGAAMTRTQGSEPRGPFFDPGTSSHTMLGEKVMDERITITADPMDPELVFPPTVSQGWWGTDPFVDPVYHATTWIDHGVLTNLYYDRDFAIDGLGLNLGNPNSGAFHMSGGATSVDEMIASTKRGLLVTRFDPMYQIDLTSLLFRGHTRDGLWLIENGKISKPLKNLVFTESILFALNNVEQLGPPVRVFNPNNSLRWRITEPAVVPPLKIRDFSFTALADSI